MDGFVQGCMEDPRYALQVQPNCLWVWGGYSSGADVDEPTVCSSVPAHQSVVHRPAKGNQESDYRSPDHTGIAEWCMGQGNEEREGMEDIVDRAPRLPHP